MSFLINSENYVEYINIVAKKINESSDYITRLDSIIGDGDHWVNINLGFEKLVAASDKLRKMPIDKVFSKIGMIMMSNIGGSSGILYGTAYIAASKVISGKQQITSEDLCAVLEAMLQEMMARGKAKPGFKTMIDALYPAVKTYKAAIASDMDDNAALQAVKQAALEGAEATRSMKGVKGRASYQMNKGVGHLDPGAVTMSYQIECLCDYIIDNLLG